MSEVIQKNDWKETVIQLRRPGGLKKSLFAKCR